MDRVSRDTLDTMLGYLCDKVGKPHGDVPGGWYMDYAPVYGGYAIEAREDTGSGVSHPFSSQRRSAREMRDCLKFALDAIYWNNQ